MWQAGTLLSTRKVGGAAKPDWQRTRLSGSLPFQHIRSDFLYAEDDPAEDGTWCIWPEFISHDGSVFPEDERVRSTFHFIFAIYLESDDVPCLSQMPILADIPRR